MPYLEARDIDFKSARSKKRLLDARVEEPAAKGRQAQHGATRMKGEPTPGQTAAFHNAYARIVPNAVILSTLPSHCDQFVNVNSSNDFPIQLHSLYSASASELSYQQLLVKASEIRISVTENMAVNVEKCTLGQKDSQEWYRYRAGRVTASVMKAACSTNPDNPSISLLKRICYPSQSQIHTEAIE